MVNEASLLDPNVMVFEADDFFSTAEITITLNPLRSKCDTTFSVGNRMTHPDSSAKRRRTCLDCQSNQNL